MTPVTLEDHLLEYIERSQGCAQVLVSPPPDHCNGQVQGWYAFLKLQPFTIAIVAVFAMVLVGMSITAFFGGDKH